MCKIIPACLNFPGIVAASHLHSAPACQSAIFGKIGKYYPNLAGTILHGSVHKFLSSLKAFLIGIAQLVCQRNISVTIIIKVGVKSKEMLLRNHMLQIAVKIIIQAGPSLPPFLELYNLSH